MTSSVVTLGPPANPTLYRGVVTGLHGGAIDAHVQSGRDALSVQARLQIDPGSGAVVGTVSTAAAAINQRGEHSDGDGGR